MFKIFLSFLVFSFLILFTTSTFADIVELERKNSAPWEDIKQSQSRIERVICVDGLKLFQTIGPAWGNGAAPVVSTLQLYESKNGKVVPVTCKSTPKSTP